MRRGTYHLNFHQGFIAIIKEVSSLAAVNANDTQEQLSTQSQGHRGLALVDNGIDTALDIGLQDVRLGKFAFDIRRQPNASQWPGFRQKSLGIEHGVCRTEILYRNKKWFTKPKEQNPPGAGIRRKRVTRWTGKTIDSSDDTHAASGEGDRDTIKRVVNHRVA